MERCPYEGVTAIDACGRVPPPPVGLPSPGREREPGVRSDLSRLAGESDRVAVPLGAVLEGPDLGVVVDADNAEALVVAVRPFEVVHQRPGEVAADVGAAESDPAKLDRAGLADAVPGWKFAYLTNWKELTATRRPSAVRGELHRSLLYGVLVFLLVESVLAWKFGHTPPGVRNAAP